MGCAAIGWMYGVEGLVRVVGYDCADCSVCGFGGV